MFLTVFRYFPSLQEIVLILIFIRVLLNSIESTFLRQFYQSAISQALSIEGL